MPKRQVKKKKELEELLDDVVSGFLALVELGSRFQKDLKKAEERVGEFKGKIDELRGKVKKGTKSRKKIRRLKIED
ncbi:MAG: hypothetical protein COS84_11990 [Armatimonadetes bacterium CG07_land_8_20_14_0_80_40_9]|nr:MAG: hypothetical protein COS84_11990 [Armatimonadetes bacterium CG07_land_8_20_14_0_80_40_9]